MRHRLVCAIALAASIGGCKTEAPVEAPNPAPLFVFSAKISHPISNTTESHAQATRDHIATLNGFANPDWLAPFAAVTPRVDGSTTTWIAVQGTLSQAFSETAQTDGSTAWRQVYNGSDGSLAYSNWVIRSGANAPGGKSVQWSGFQPNSVLKAVDVFAARETDSTIILSLVEYAANGSVKGKVVITQAADTSGYLDSYRYDGVQFLNWFESQWAADGSGTWTEFDANGQPTASGTWTK
jgi:hypothetical protein